MAIVQPLTQKSQPTQPVSAGTVAGVSGIADNKSTDSKLLHARLVLLEIIARMEQEMFEKDKDDMVVASQVWKREAAKWKRHSAASEVRVKQLAADVARCGEEVARLGIGRAGKCVVKVDNGEAEKAQEGGL
ncbi:unnamed protein product [Zymoseptoria tritici ST99CH_1A5]|uniref:Uncharacterized protein n=2 Tax=Zymoseptoria tritici TaxID=1047171 RepID=A0A2H1H5G8_ZYMTR|nr:unnamed protein product [Zymoseptoria tritici ST99CH_1E4]SMY29544.1 unnamed protein product [Zymoseptoria tritici ST99CH_1A5]